LYYYQYKMYCTIAPREASSPGLSPDAWRSYTTLRTHARSLAGLSASFAHEAAEISRTYEQALQLRSESHWRAFVAICNSLVDHCNSVDTAIGFTSHEREAWKYFAQIVDENRDLLELVAHTAA
jgi:hypothetical protein